MSEFIVNPLYSRYRSFVESIAEYFSTNGEMIYNKRNVVKSFDEDGMRLVVKRYKVPLFVQRVAYTWFRPSKAKRAYVFGLRLQELGINTPEPVGCVEKKRCGLFRQGYFISTYTEHDSLKDHRDELLAEPIFFDSYVRFLIEMHEKGFLHGDQNLSNILFWTEDGDYRFEVIDINRSHFSDGPASKSQCLSNLMRITRDRSLSGKIVGRYAEIRGWDVDQSIEYVNKQIDKYERKRRMRRFYHKIFPKKHS